MFNLHYIIFKKQNQGKARKDSASSLFSRNILNIFLIFIYFYPFSMKRFLFFENNGWNWDLLSINFCLFVFFTVKWFCMRKRIKPVVLLVFFISFISFLVLSRTIADMQARAQQETTQTIPNSNTPKKQLLQALLLKKRKTSIQNWLAARSLISQAGNCLVKLITMSSPKMWEVWSFVSIVGLKLKRKMQQPT